MQVTMHGEDRSKHIISAATIMVFDWLLFFLYVPQ